MENFSKFYLKIITKLKFACNLQQVTFILIGFNTIAAPHPYRTLDGKYGFVDNNNKNVVINPIYEFVEPFFDGKACVKINSQYGVIDPTGKYIITPKYDFLSVFLDYFIVGRGMGKGFLKVDGSILTPIKFYNVNPFFKWNCSCIFNGRFC